MVDQIESAKLVNLCLLDLTVYRQVAVTDEPNEMLLDGISPIRTKYEPLFTLPAYQPIPASGFKHMSELRSQEHYWETLSVAIEDTPIDVPIMAYYAPKLHHILPPIVAPNTYFVVPDLTGLTSYISYRPDLLSPMYDGEFCIGFYRHQLCDRVTGRRADWWV